MQIQVLNKSTALHGEESLLACMCAAVNYQVKHDFSPAWGLAPASVSFCADDKHIVPGAWLVYIFDDADQAGALGYHDETPQGQPYARVFAKTIISYGGTVAAGSNSVSVCLSHEVLEMIGDPTCDYWGQAEDGTCYAKEMGDPVENDSYTIAVGAHTISVSNFVLPAWFDCAAPTHAKFDYLGKLRAPFTLSAGGYVIFMTGGQVQQKFGENYPGWKKATKQHPAARTSKRG